MVDPRLIRLLALCELMRAELEEQPAIAPDGFPAALAEFYDAVRSEADRQAAESPADALH